jgi:signal peptidase
MLKKIVSLFEWLIFALLVFLAFVVMSPMLPTKKFLLTYIVSSGSMEPTIQTGSIAFVKPVEKKEIKKGDIITFLSPKDQKLTILHRVFKIKNTKNVLSFETKGDNNNAEDNWEVPAVNLQGRYLFSVPLLGHIAALMKKPLGFILMIGVPALFLIILQIKTIRDGINEEVEKRTKKALKDLEEKKAQLTSLKTVLIFLFLANLFVFGAGAKSLKAAYSTSAIVGGISFSVKDFVPPPVPTLISPTDNSVVTSTGLVMDWSDVTDYENQHDPVYYIFQMASDAAFTSSVYTSEHLVPSQITAPSLLDGEYWWHVQACDAVDNCSAWSEIWKFTITAPVVSIDPAFTKIIDGAACGLGNAWLDDGLKIDVEHWNSNYKLQGRYFTGGGSFGGWNNLLAWGHTEEQIGNTRIFKILNTDDTPNDGPAGWEVQVTDAGGNVLSNLASLSYIITKNQYSLVCNGKMTMGFETAETGTLDGVGQCPVFTKDKSQNNNQASLQILKWNNIPFATKYRITGYKKNGSNWETYGSPYFRQLGDPNFAITGDIAKYTAYATAEVTTAYYIEALTASDIVVGQTETVITSSTCTFTVDRTPPVSTFSSPDPQENISENPIAITGTSTDLNGVSKLELLYANYTGSCGAFTSSIITLDNSSNNSPFDWSHSWTPDAGIYCIKAEATDLAGNKENSPIVEGIVFAPEEPQPSPTTTETATPTENPTLTPEPTATPSAEPTVAPTAEPTIEPQPTTQPEATPTDSGSSPE